MKTFLFQIYNPGSLIANIQTHIIFYFAFENFQIDNLADQKFRKIIAFRKHIEKKKILYIDITFREREIITNP